MAKKYLNLSEFKLEGEFVGFGGEKPQESKYLQLKIPSGEVEIKVPKALRLSISESLVIGEQISVSGVSKLHSQTGKIKLKAHGVSPVNGCPNSQITLSPKAKILVCQKSSCRKRGGKGLLSELEKTLCDRGLSEHVTIEGSGCLKRCNSAPNCVVKFGKKEYSKLHPEAVVRMLLSDLPEVNNK
ncbi:MAG: (2Fe-2S) ferredoxin domain-containing protein [Nostocaceae cyanobacterium]|nr:(2Fe-2S) ferredoxin domain-containing protein [Nostocaceae cyanobacterium]